MPGSFVDTSALAKHYHLESGSAQVDHLWADFGRTLFISRVGVVARRLRTLDALQLAVALDLQGRGMVDLLVSSDQHLLEAARTERILVFDPENHVRQTQTR